MPSPAPSSAGGVPVSAAPEDATRALAPELARLDVRRATEVSMPTAQLLGQTVSIRGNGAETVGGIEGAVAASAQRAYQALTPAQQETARQVFTRLTTTASDGTDTAIPAARADLTAGTGSARPGEVEAVLDKFGPAFVYEVARTRWRLAEALAETGDRAAAQEQWDQAVEIADEIYSVPGLDAVFVGPNDLTYSMRSADGSFASKETFEATLTRIREAAKRNNLPCGLHVFSPADALRRAAEGWQFIAVNSELKMMLEGAADLTNQISAKPNPEALAKY